MVDDSTQRPFRSNDTIARGGPAKAPEQGARSGSDPLAELARLIGQSDPFSEFGRDGARRVAAPRPPEPVHDWNPEPPAGGFAPPPIPPAPHAAGNDYFDPAPAPAPVVPNFGRQPFGGAPLAGSGEIYQVDGPVPGYPAPHTAGYEDDHYSHGDAQHAAEEDEYYDDATISRRRMGVMVIAGVFALAVIGTAGAFGYRALFGSSSSSSPPRVIKADTAPSKVVPAATDSQSNKQITDRINDRGIGEKLVSREEQPVDIKDKAAGVVGNSQPAGAASMGSGVVGSEPKKVRTIQIHPDQQASTEPMPAAAPAPVQTPPRVTNVTPPKPAAVVPAPAPAPAPPPRVVNNPPPAADDAGPSPAATRVAPRVAAAPAPSNAPLSLSPDAPAPRPAAPARAPAPPRTAAAPAAPAASGGYAVQVSSQRSEAEAQAAFRSLQGKYPDQLGGKQAVIRQVDLGDKGVYYRAMVPSATGSEATELCTSLKAAGGSCIIQRN